MNAASSHVRGNQVVLGEMQAYVNAVIAGSVKPSAFGGYVYDGWGCGEGNGAMRSDPNGVILSCQNGVWRAASGSGVKTGLQGVLAPLKNYQISCNPFSSTLYYAYVDGNGNPYTRIVASGDTGYVYGTKLGRTMESFTHQVEWDPTGISGTATSTLNASTRYSCTAYWPAT